MKTLTATNFAPFNIFEPHYPIKTDLVYARVGHPDNHFKNLYHPDANLLWAHKDIIPIVLLASLIGYQMGWTLKLNDCLRPVEAQERMAQYGYDPNLVSTPGAGAHPRGMAIDIQPLLGPNISEEMGTAFDHFTDNLNDNPAARNYTRFPAENLAEIFAVRRKRNDLETTMCVAADILGQSILPLPQEWWDFRFEEGVENRCAAATYWGDYAPLRESDLPSYMHLVGEPGAIPANIEEDLRLYAIATDELVRSKAATVGVRHMNCMGRVECV